MEVYWNSSWWDRILNGQWYSWSKTDLNLMLKEELNQYLLCICFMPAAAVITWCVVLYVFLHSHVDYPFKELDIISISLLRNMRLKKCELFAKYPKEIINRYEIWKLCIYHIQEPHLWRGSRDLRGAIDKACVPDISHSSSLHLRKLSVEMTETEKRKVSLLRRRREGLMIFKVFLHAEIEHLFLSTLWFIN